MPTYEFECQKCHGSIEIEKSIHDDNVPLCCAEGCNSIEMVQRISKSSFSLSGTGWSKDGYSTVNR